MKIQMDYFKMILFDYGHILLYEPDWDPARGNAEFLRYAVKNRTTALLMILKRVQD